MFGTLSAMVRMGTTSLEGPRRRSREMLPVMVVCQNGEDSRLVGERFLGLVLLTLSSWGPSDIVCLAGWN